MCGDRPSLSSQTLLPLQLPTHRTHLIYLEDLIFGLVMIFKKKSDICFELSPLLRCTSFFSKVFYAAASCITLRILGARGSVATSTM